MQDIKFKYTFYFFKKGLLIFISHLDLIRLFEKAFKRSGLPVVYSQGFNPHLRLSLPFPLSLGHAGEQEIGEVFLSAVVKPAEFLNSMNKNLPLDIQLARVELSQTKDSLVNHARSFTYRIIFKPGQQPKNLADLLGQDLMIEKTSKNGNISRYALRENVSNFEIKQDTLYINLLIKEQKTINPEQLLEKLGIGFEQVQDIVREKLSFKYFLNFRGFQEIFFKNITSMQFH